MTRDERTLGSGGALLQLTAYADFAGDADLLATVRTQLGAALVHDIVVGNGPKDLERVWLDVLAGKTAPREGNVPQL